MTKRSADTMKNHKPKETQIQRFIQRVNALAAKHNVEMKTMAEADEDRIDPFALQMF